MTVAGHLVSLVFQVSLIVETRQTRQTDNQIHRIPKTRRKTIPKQRVSAPFPKSLLAVD